ncbi:extracellular solute-binding protein [Vallitalea okinawensis]|uniref:extracellular solute-binding protein n=1 Tax=Vallitalea okinawensis TaxID=2078660 RepID=UPI000CFA98E9|nr:extracellular solute-binding protein [Vallitalea okinawensis]
MLKRVLCFTMVLVLLISMSLTGCEKKEDVNTEQNDVAQDNASTTQEETNTEETTTYDEPLPFHFVSRGTPVTELSATQIAFRDRMKELYNVDMEYQVIGNSAYEEKVNVMFASGDVPDMIFMRDLAKIGQAIDAGVFVPVTDIVENDPNWSQIDKQLLAAGYYNGDYYTLIEKKNFPDAMIYREDWAEKLNIKEPTNPDEVLDMLIAFAKNDPDENGKDDTYGISLAGDYGSQSPVWKMFVPAGPQDCAIYWDQDDDTIKSALYLKKDMKTALSWFRKAYAEGGLDPEYILDKASDAENKFVTGKTGMWIKAPLWLENRIKKMEPVFPDLNLNTIAPIETKYGTNHDSTDSSASGYYLTKNCSDIERGKKVLAYWSGPEGIWLRSVGVEGEQYVYEDNGNFKFIDEEKEQGFNAGTLLASVHDLVPPVLNPMVEKNFNKANDFAIRKGINVVMSKSDEFQQVGVDIEKYALEVITKIIMGEKPVDAYDEVIEEIDRLGADKMLEEMNQIFSEMN